MKERRRWRDGPRWPWLCRVLGHQMEWSQWYIGAGDELGAAVARWLGGSSEVKPSWHRGGMHCMQGRLCGRCALVVQP